jgi:hypothetical protein
LSRIKPSKLILNPKEEEMEEILLKANLVSIKLLG